MMFWFLNIFGSLKSIIEPSWGNSIARYLHLFPDPLANKSNPVSFGAKLVQRRRQISQQSKHKCWVDAISVEWSDCTFSGTPLHIRSLITKPNAKADQSCIYPSPPSKSVHFIGGQGSWAHHGMPCSPSQVWHPPPHIVDCLHIWPLPRGRIHFGWHRCILTDWSFWFGSQGNSLDFSFIVNFLKLKVGLIKNLSMEKIKYLWLQSSRICGLARSEFMIMGWGGHLMPW